MRNRHTGQAFLWGRRLRVGNADRWDRRIAPEGHRAEAVEEEAAARGAGCRKSSRGSWGRSADKP